jgi:hypothetical protein
MTMSNFAARKFYRGTLTSNGNVKFLSKEVLQRYAFSILVITINVSDKDLSFEALPSVEER